MTLNVELLLVLDGVTVPGSPCCPVIRQLVVWAISADRAAGVHGSRADSPPPVAHFPAPF